MNNFCVVGIDCGGTNTECAIVSSRGECLGIGCGGASNPNYVERDTVYSSIETAARLADGAAGTGRPPVLRVACVGLRIGAPGAEAILERRFGGEVSFLNEGEAALACIDVFDRVGLACIAGTGSICFGFGTDGTKVIHGGWGAPLGDEGGAYDVALAGLRAAGRAIEGRGPRTLLESLAAGFVGGEIDRRRMSYVGLRWSRAEIAAFAKSVSDAAEQGDEVAAGILDRAADELAELALSVARLLFPAEAEFPVALHGGVFNAQRVSRRLTAAIRERYPRARVSKPTHSPGVAAALLILHDLRVERVEGISL